MLLSMVSHLDIMMYLVAIKSFYRHLKRGKIVVLNDGTLTEKDKRLLATHINPLQVLNINEVKTHPCPKGAWWERLLLIADYVKDHYVIQLDSDSLVISEIPEVMECVNRNISFALGSDFNINGEYLGKEIFPMDYVCQKMKLLKNDYIEVVADQNLDKLPDYSTLKYSRCSACFAGFAKGSFSRREVEDFSGKMQGILGKRWSEWGTEKITSAYIVSNSPRARILPYPKYVSYYADPAIDYTKSAYLHFTGTHRFKNGFYINMARKVIQTLMPEGRN